MHVIRKFAKIMAPSLGLILLLSSCSRYEDLSGSDELTMRYSGEELFLGLFFFQNEISEGISEIRNIKKELDEYVAMNSEIARSLKELSAISVEHIRTNYPGFFKEFQDKMYSGNFYEMESVMNKAVHMIQQATLATPKFSKANEISAIINSDAALREKMLGLNLNDEQERLEFSNLLSERLNLEDIDIDAVFFAAVATIAYVVAGVVSFVFAAYSVVTKAAYWDWIEDGPPEFKQPGYLSPKTSVQKEITIAEINEFLSVGR